MNNNNNKKLIDTKTNKQISGYQRARGVGKGEMGKAGQLIW